MTKEDPEIERLKNAQATFRSKFQVLKNAKTSLLKLFRQKLEERRTEEIKQTIINSPKE